ncbi:potassium channel family protein [Angustibacter sp. McL0619]|uniref:potassium channel family protein n=1 Tax=Angustibacter sp. McL0619 TaxID=3415676 RepID=UPI003CE8CD01
MSNRAWAILGTIAVLVAVSLVYAYVPWTDYEPKSSFVVALAFAVGVVGSAGLVFWQITRYRSGRGRGAEQLRGLFTAMWIAVLFFSAVYFIMAANDPGQMSGLHTRLDAVYFTLSTASTVGFGDITASGQAARAIVCLNIVFNLVVLALAVTAIREGRHRQPEA